MVPPTRHRSPCLHKRGQEGPRLGSRAPVEERAREHQVAEAAREPGAPCDFRNYLEHGCGLWLTDDERLEGKFERSLQQRGHVREADGAEAVGPHFGEDFSRSEFVWVAVFYGYALLEGDHLRVYANHVFLLGLHAEQPDQPLNGEDSARERQELPETPNRHGARFWSTELVVHLL